MSEGLYNLWLEVRELAATIQFSEQEDELIWCFNTSGVYSSQSLYRIINFRGIETVHVSSVWSLKIPLRVQYFLWLVIKNRALARDNLAKRRKVDDDACLYCAEKESIFHVFFECAVAKQCWEVMSVMVGHRIGEIMFEVGKMWLCNKRFCLDNMISSAVIWSVWKLRNDLLFQRVGWRSMEMLLLRIAGLLTNWIILCPEDKRSLLSTYIQKIKTAAGETLWLPHQRLSGP